MNEYFIVILNWNGWKDTEVCIQSIFRNELKKNYTIILVDNGSTNDELLKIEEFVKENHLNEIIGDKNYFLSEITNLPVEFEALEGDRKIVIIKNNENLGFAGGNNVGLKFLQKINKKYVLLLNNDTEIDQLSLDKMFNYLQKPTDKTCVAVIPQIRYFNPNNLIWNCGGSINFLGVRKYYHAFEDGNVLNLKGEKKVDYGTGCALFFDLSKVGLLSDKFFFGEEDFELAFRLRRQNYSTYCINNAIIYHKVGTSRKKISDEKIGNMVYHYSQRLSNLKDNLNPISWRISVLAHIYSSYKLLRKDSLFSFKRIYLMWVDILSNVKNISRFSREDFLNISIKKY